MAYKGRSRRKDFTMTEEEVNNPKDMNTVLPVEEKTVNKTLSKQQQQQNLALFNNAISAAQTQYDALNDEADQYNAIATASPTQYERRNYVKEILEQHKQAKPSEDELKRERNRRRAAAVADGLIALSNFAGAAAGATPLEQKKTLTEAQKARFEEALKMRDGYKTREERNAELNAAVQQQRSEDNYYNRLATQEASTRKTAAQMVTAKREKASKIMTDLYKKAAELGIKDSVAKSIIDKNFKTGKAATDRAASYDKRVNSQNSTDKTKAEAYSYGQHHKGTGGSSETSWSQSFSYDEDGEPKGNTVTVRGKGTPPKKGNTAGKGKSF